MTDNAFPAEEVLLAREHVKNASEPWLLGDYFAKGHELDWHPRKGIRKCVRCGCPFIDLAEDGMYPGGIRECRP